MANNSELDRAWHDVQATIPDNVAGDPAARYHAAMQRARTQLNRPTAPARRDAQVIDLTAARRRRAHRPDTR